MIEARWVECYYGSIRVLQRINLSAKRGEFIGIIGPNGSGKTSLIRCMSRVLKPTIGSVVIKEKDIYTLKPKEVAKDVAVVSQDTKVNFHFTSIEIVLMGRTPHLNRFETEREEDIKSAYKAMEMTNTQKLADRPITELSGGERQRVIIARALAQEPKIMFLDEPTANLDINYRLEILDLLKNLSKKQGLIVIVAIHDLNLAAQYCNSLVMLDHGKIVCMGSPDEVLTPENVEKVFRVKTLVKRHPVTNYLNVTLLSSESKSVIKKDFTIHVICGGGTGGKIINLLSKVGYRVTTGVLNALDTDHEVAQSLGILMISEAPFSPITEESHHANLDLIAKANAVILTNPPFGYGNIKNLEAAKFAFKQQIPLLILEENGEIKSDYVFEEAEKILNRLKRDGAIVVKNQDELLHAIEGLEGVK